MRVLVIEDEKRLSEALCQILGEQKYMTDSAFDGVSGYEYAKSGAYDLIILDIMLPGIDGFEVVSRLRKDGVSTPVLMLTARESVPDKIKGLDSGADDYMTKPFSPGELLARIRVLTRRRGEVVLDELRCGDVTFSLSSSELCCGTTGKSVRLNFKEAEIIKLLLSKPEIIIPKEEIITRVWGYDSDAGDNNVEAYMSFLRKKLFFIGSKCEIVSMRKLGYRIEVPKC